MSTHSAVSAASNNATSVKATAGRLFRVQASNNNAAARYLKIYDKASAPAPASDVPVLRYMIPPAGVLPSTPCDYWFAAGLAYVVVTGAGDTNNDSTGASETFVNIDYE